MPHLVLKVDVDTKRGTHDGVPNLLAVLKKYQAHATFLFSLGPDNTGKAIKRVFRRGFLKKVSRTSVVEHYGLKTLLYGTLLPAPDIGLSEKAILKMTQDAGFEVGIHTWDHIKWQDNVATQSKEWTVNQMQKAYDRFIDIFGVPSLTHGAAGWQMNEFAYKNELDLGIKYASDCRGYAPFIPMNKDNEVIGCVQLPTTLPTLDELIGIDGMDCHNVDEHILNITKNIKGDHVYTLHAELEGMLLLPTFERLLQGFINQGYTLSSMADLYDSLNLGSIPKEIVTMNNIEGRSGVLSMQERKV